MSSDVVLVTGGAGYLGESVVSALTRAGFRVTAIDDLSSGTPNQSTLADPFIRVDVRDRSALHAIISQQRPVAVVHLAGRHCPKAASERPEVAHEVNVGGTAALLAAMKTRSTRVFVHGSDIRLYGRSGHDLDEDTPPNPFCPLGHAVRAAEQVITSCSTAWGLRGCSLRFTDLGGADPATEISPRTDRPTPFSRLLKAAIQNKARHPFAIHEPSTAVDMIHVAEAADATVRAVQVLLAGGESPPALNITAGRTVGLSALRSVMESLVGGPLAVRKIAQPSWQTRDLSASNQRAFDWLGWRPAASAEDCLRSGWEKLRPEK